MECVDQKRQFWDSWDLNTSYVLSVFSMLILLSGNGIVVVKKKNLLDYTEKFTR